MKNCEGETKSGLACPTKARNVLVYEEEIGNVIIYVKRAAGTSKPPGGMVSPLDRNLASRRSRSPRSTWGICNNNNNNNNNNESVEKKIEKKGTIEKRKCD